MKIAIKLIFWQFILWVLPITTQAQFTFTTNSGTITITGYTGTSGTVIIPSTAYGYPITTIGTGVFENNIALTSVIIGTNVTSIGDAAFYGCYSLTNVTIPNSVVSIGDNADEYGVFGSCSNLSNITIPNSVTSIGASAFSSCSRLTSIMIPTNVTSIYAGAFEYCDNLTNATIPASVNNIRPAPWEGCTKLTAITVATNNPSYVSVAGVLFDRNQTKLIEYPDAKSGSSYTVPNTVNDIWIDAFAWTTLTSVTIPNSVINIENYAFHWNNLTSVTIPSSVAIIGKQAFEFGSLTNVCFEGNAPSDGGNAFNSNAGLSAVYYVYGATGWGSTYDGIPTIFCPECGAIFSNPFLLSPAIKNNQVVLSWLATQGKSCQLQYKSNLTQVNWINVGSTVTASNAILFATNAIGSDKQRFYRIWQQ